MSESEKKEAQADLTSGKKKFESATKSVINKNTSQGKAAVKILEQYKTDIDSSVKQETHQSETENQSNYSRTDYTSVSNIQMVQEPHTNTPQDLFASLTKKFPKEQIWIIRKIFKSLTDNCPKGHLMLIEDLKKLVIKDLER